jgi:hypothetical protein
MILGFIQDVSEVFICKKVADQVIIVIGLKERQVLKESADIAIGSNSSIRKQNE